MINEVDVSDMKELYELQIGQLFRLASKDGVQVPPDSNDFEFSGIFKFMGVDGMYSKCYDSDGVLHHFAAWTKVIPWVA
jgi:hypothetical protein